MSATELTLNQRASILASLKSPTGGLGGGQEGDDEEYAAVADGSPTQSPTSGSVDREKEGGGGDGGKEGEERKGMGGLGEVVVGPDSLLIGQHLTVYSRGKWRPCQLTKMTETSGRVHFVGASSQFDEWVCC